MRKFALFNLKNNIHHTHFTNTIVELSFQTAVMSDRNIYITDASRGIDNYGIKLEKIQNKLGKRY